MSQNGWERLLKWKIETLGDVITNYDRIVAGMGHGISSNNAKFNEGLESIVDELFNK